MKTARLNRLFGTSGNCFDVAIDHGMFNEKTFLGGIENMQTAIDIVAKAAPDAIHNYHQVRHPCSNNALGRIAQP